MCIIPATQEVDSCPDGSEKVENLRLVHRLLFMVFQLGMSCGLSAHAAAKLTLFYLFPLYVWEAMLTCDERKQGSNKPHRPEQVNGLSSPQHNYLLEENRLTSAGTLKVRQMVRCASCLDTTVAHPARSSMRLWLSLIIRECALTFHIVIKLMLSAALAFPEKG